MRVVEGVVRVRGTLHRPPALYIRAFRKILVRVVRVNEKKIFLKLACLESRACNFLFTIEVLLRVSNAFVFVYSAVLTNFDELFL